MYKQIYLPLLLSFFMFSSSAQNTVLWKVTDTHSSKTSYILGTYHLIGSGFIDSYPVIKEKINAADVVITETKMERVKAREYYNSRPSSERWGLVLSTDDMDYIKEIFKHGKIDIEKFTPGELYVKLLAFYPKYKCNSIKNEDTLSMDEYIQYLGNQDHKKAYYFETDSFQLEKITAITNVYDWAFFKKNIPAVLKKYRSKDIDPEQCQLANQYASFNLDYKFSTTWSASLKGVVGNSELIKKRDDDWMKQIPSLLENNNCFIAVGLLHLYFDCGLLEQLKKRGYLIEEVKMK
ncbi:MAG: TraB/GumN family protein [Ferruginibacter sp.]